MNGELEQLGERIAEQAAHLDAAMHRLLTDLREFDMRGGWHVQGAATCAHWLAWRIGWDLVTARDHVRVARKLAEFAQIDDALRRGELSYSKVRALLRVATPENEALLLDHARLMTASQLEKLCHKYALVQRHGQDSHPDVDEQRRYVRRRDLEDGMVKIEAVLHPEEAELVWTMLDHAASRLAREAAAAATATGGTAHQNSAEPAGTSDPESPQAESDSAESQAAAEPCCAAVGSSARIPDFAGSAVTGDVEPPQAESDSAESRAAAEPCRAAVGSSARIPDFAGSAVTGDVESLQAESDSAESQAAAVPCCAAVDSPAEALDSAESARLMTRNHQTRSDSAESPAAAEPCCAAASTPAGTSVVERTESTRPSTIAYTAGAQTEWVGSATVAWSSAEPTEWTGTTQAGDSAACSEVAGRSLRDRLLEDAEALRSSEPIAADAAAELHDSPAPTPSEHKADPRKEQPTQRSASVLRDRAAAARKAFNRANALVELAQGYFRGDRPDRSPIEVMLTVPASMLRDEHADPVEVAELGESFLSRDTARRLSCDAGVVEIVEDAQGTPLSVGRKQRTIAGALRRALHRRDGSCTYPGCTNRLFLEGHHIKHWADGGETSLSNAILVCSLHHRHVHELGYTVELGQDNRPRFRDPQGRLVAAVPQPPALVDLGWPQIRAANEPLAIDATTIAGPWDGTPVDYARIVGHLVAAEGLA
jgi:hypothetical protein